MIFLLQISIPILAWNIALVDNDDTHGHSNRSYNSDYGYDGQTHFFNNNHYLGDARKSTAGQHPYVGEWAWYQWIFFTPFEKETPIYINTFNVYLWDASFNEPEASYVFINTYNQLSLYPVNQKYAYAGWNALISTPTKIPGDNYYNILEGVHVDENGLKGYNVGANVIYIELQ